MGKIKILDYVPQGYNQNDEFEYLKLCFINENYKNESTKKTFWYVYKKIVHEFELKYDKDVSLFTLSKIEEMFRETEVAITTKRNMLSFIQRYNEWCINNGLIEDNVLKNINLQQLLTAPKVDLRSNYISFEELYKNTMWIESDSSNSITLIDVMIVLLMRSGIRASEIVDMRYSDINYVTGEVEFESDGKTIKKHLEKFILRIIKEVQETEYHVKCTKSLLLTIDNHVVKTLDANYDREKMNKNIKKRVSKFKNVYRTLNENILLTSYKIDLVEEIAAKKEMLTVKDFQDIQVRCGNSAGSYQKLREDYGIYKNKS